MRAKLDIGRTYSRQSRVEEWMTAEKAGNKGADVLSTSMLVQLIENAAVAALVSTGCSRHTFGMPKASAATHAAISARDGTAIPLIDLAVMVCDRWPNRWLVSTP